MKLLLVLLLSNLALIVPVQGAHCGRNLWQNVGAAIALKKVCGGQAADSCCYAHDQCYNNQLGKRYCDDIFCDCVDAAYNGDLFCRGLTEGFCLAVTHLGHEAYDNAALKQAAISLLAQELEAQPRYKGPMPYPYPGLVEEYSP